MSHQKTKVAVAVFRYQSTSIYTECVSVYTQGCGFEDDLREKNRSRSGKFIEASEVESIPFLGVIAFSLLYISFLFI